jgi:hypothetical protein
MTQTALTTPLPVQTLQVFAAEAFRVAHGVNEGDPICEAGGLVLEDTYVLDPDAGVLRLGIAGDESSGGFSIAEGSETGRAGAPLYLDSLVTFMGPHGSTDEALILVEIDSQTRLIAQCYLHPLTPLEPGQGYALVTIDRAAARARLAESACVAFLRGTRITMADGRQVPVEDLRPGARILTRDSGPQVLRWIGEQTVRATGAFAPIVIAPGTLNNDGALTISPNHRLFIYQRVDEIGAGAREILIKARHLVNGTTVTRSEGGFVDYFQLLFDKHEILYAEGIAAESLFVDATTRSAMPDAVKARLTGDVLSTHGARELRARDVDPDRAAELLKRASLH